jgi:hypothetical protein
LTASGDFGTTSDMALPRFVLVDGQSMMPFNIELVAGRPIERPTSSTWFFSAAVALAYPTLYAVSGLPSKSLS